MGNTFKYFALFSVDMYDILLGSALLIGTIIGAGVFGLPYTFMLAGFPLGVLSLIIAEILMIITSLLLIEMGRKGDEIPDILERYIGRWGKALTSISLIFLTVGAISAYNQGIGESLEILFGISRWITLPILIIFMSLLSFRGIRSVAKGEGILVSFLIVFMLSLSIFLLPNVRVENLRYINPRYFFYALGAAIFAVSGYSAVPELLKIGDKRKGYIAVLLAHLFVFFVYIFFSMAFIGNYGKSLSQLAVENLSGALEILGLLTAVVAMLTSYMALGFVLYNVYKDSLKIPWQISLILTYVIPFFISMFSGAGFADIISITGGIAMPLTGTLVGLAYMRYSKGKLGRFLGFSSAGIYFVLLLETILRFFI